ncbi:hypothetical protein BKA66DRAFT_529825 [Pyrenochaeta sp. MPI-SDFR-AT-0127]|nr:hypothetical protein BKA66DRAFT_529825 [Pyrenochaeta sp. MPI-SDFR-AT-0127]
MARRRAQSPLQETRQRRRRFIKAVESDNDVDQTESQQILALRPLLRKSKSDNKGLQQFHAKVADDKKRLRAVVEDRMRHAKEMQTRHSNDIASMICEALKSSNRPLQSECPTYSGTKIASNAIHASITNVLTASKGLVNEYERLDKMITDLQNEHTLSMASTWKRDIYQVEEQLKLGARVALTNVKKVLGADVKGDREKTASEHNSGDMMEVPGMGEDELNYELQKSLRYAERGVKRMTKGLPEDAAQQT